MFINFGDNANLDGMGFSPFAKVVEGMDVVNQIFKGYGEGAPSGEAFTLGAQCNFNFMHSLVAVALTHD
jgi:cyclophilin family peptidyl-prolyl cis-trans isomerase